MKSAQHWEQMSALYTTHLTTFSLQYYFQDNWGISINGVVLAEANDYKTFFSFDIYTSLFSKNNSVWKGFTLKGFHSSYTQPK